MNVKQQKERAKAYRKYAERMAARSQILKNCTRAFLVGGGICGFAQCLLALFNSFGIEEDHSRLLVSVSLMTVTALLTGIGVFDRSAKFSGAGTLVPITGFANSVVSSALDTKTEGFVLGVGAKMFIIAGPVIVYGTLASVVYGVIYWVTTFI